MITISKLTRRYGDNTAVDDVSFEIGRGEIVGLLGHNGAGKTTLMKVLTGYLEPSQGTISVDGHDVVEQRIEAQQMIGYLPEAAPLYGEMLVQDYLLMMAGLRGVAPSEADNAVVEAILATDLADRALDPIRTLSKGLRQRVGIAQAIVHKPAVLVLDEPTNGLDPTQIRAIRDLINRLGQDTTVLLSTHILQEIEAVCDRVIVLMSGKVVTDAPLADLVTSRDIRITVNAEEQAARTHLHKLTGVQKVTYVGPDSRPGFHSYLVTAVDQAALAPLLASSALEAGWQIAAVAPDRVSLEHVFAKLEDEHIASAGGAA